MTTTTTTMIVIISVYYLLVLNFIWFHFPFNLSKIFCSGLVHVHFAMLESELLSQEMHITCTEVTSNASVTCINIK
jgi:hypothetical protein